MVVLAAMTAEKLQRTKYFELTLLGIYEGGYAEVLCVQQNRKGEGERMKKWAESVWRNQRLSLAEALEISEPSKVAAEIAEPSKVAVIDARVRRVI